ncbi:NAD(P)/FAD-dependent oxidoreductase [Streptomyces sp. NBC_00237]|uniref:phytoene desaturase family protein n=1 Tax=Streptomyces sp. NBC_00237 TaxID=2975687 RepID=UPI00224E3A90|nr:NAD(P)/FAD-dependent oxidoreductase [Streptomyces sp. NBC_00237]MCX5202773.1 NAD(P)/FAD-dependent oxidoreductase [Streptomyces sp. NBC_00237]
MAPHSDKRRPDAPRGPLPYDPVSAAPRGLRAYAPVAAALRSLRSYDPRTVLPRELRPSALATAALRALRPTTPNADTPNGDAPDPDAPDAPPASGRGPRPDAPVGPRGARRKSRGLARRSRPDAEDAARARRPDAPGAPHGTPLSPPAGSRTPSPGVPAAFRTEPPAVAPCAEPPAAPRRAVRPDRTPGPTHGGTDRPLGHGSRGSRPYDAVIVGGGVGGLVCAAYLAVSGLRVLLAEQHDVTGGNAQVFRRRRAYEFDVGMHYVGDCGPGGLLPAILSGLGVGPDRVAFRPLDPDGFDRIVLPGTTVDVGVGWNKYLKRLSAALPAERRSLARCVHTLRDVAADLRAGMTTRPGAARAPMTRSLISWGGRTLGELYDVCGLSPTARTLIAAQSGNYGTPPSTTLTSTHATMLDHYLRGAYAPVGSGQTMIATLVEVIEAHGGQVRTRCPVERILVTDDRRVEGVLLADGETVHAPLVVSNVDYRRTVLDLCGGRGFSTAVLDRTRRATMRAAVATAYIALDRPLDLPNTNIWWWGGTDIEAAYARALTGDGSDPTFAFLSFGSLKDPDSRTVCPPGHSNFQIMTLMPPLEGPPGRYRRDPAYEAVKSRLRDNLVDIAESVLGPVRPHLTHLETATAHTNHRYIQGGSGTPYGFDDWGGHGRRPSIRTGVGGLYAVGANSSFGAGILGTALSGISAAGRILNRPLLSEVCAGTTLADPGQLPPRTPDFDPLRISRGLARRDARGLARID